MPTGIYDRKAKKAKAKKARAPAVKQGDAFKVQRLMTIQRVLAVLEKLLYET